MRRREERPALRHVKIHHSETQINLRDENHIFYDEAGLAWTPVFIDFTNACGRVVRRPSGEWLRRRRSDPIREKSEEKGEENLGH